MSREELNKILENHKHWFNEDYEGWQYMRANLYGADLRGVDLRKADLREANLCEANLYGADLREADLRKADLRKADLYGADLREANLCEANLCGANLYEADLYGAENIPYIPMACPEEGTFIGWKKSKSGLIVKLEIPEDALRSSATGRKCRCNKAKVLAIYNTDGTESDVKETYSYYKNDFFYKVGETVEVKDFNTDRWNECSAGIHFFINRREAVEYGF